VQLIAGCFRGSGRPFLDHLVGTASILASYGASPAVLAGTLHHASYSHGRFPEEVRGASAMRRWLRRRVGDAAEEVAFAYATLDQVKYDDQDLEALPIDTANAILIRIANAIE